MLKPNAKLTQVQSHWLGLTGILLTNSLCWAKFQRACLGAYKVAGLSWIFRDAKIAWDYLLLASVTMVLEQRGITEGVLVLDESDRARSKQTKRLNLILQSLNFKLMIKNLRLAIVSIFVVVLQIFLPVFAHAPHDDVQSLAISPAFAKDNTIFSVVRTNVLKSTNRGASWKRLVQGLDNKSFAQLVAIDPISPNILYLSTVSDGIYKSENAGDSWRKINQGLDALNIFRIYVPPASSHAVAFASGKQRSLYRTLNGGRSWFKVYDNQVAITAINGFSWVFPNNRTVLIGDNNGTLSLSTDGGLIWNKIFEKPNCGAITSIETSQKPLLRNIFFLGTSLCGVFRTIDGGKSFQQKNLGIKDLNIRSVAISPDFKNDAIVVASTWSQAIFVSSNAGLSWTKYDEGITTDIQADQAGVPDFDKIIISPDFRKDKTIFLAGFNGLFKSVNGGQQWNQIDTTPPSLIQSIAISPDYKNDRSIALTTYLSGIYKSNYDGVFWNRIADNIDARNSDIVFSPDYVLDQTMFVSTLPPRIGKSTDQGKSWVSNSIKNIPTIIALSPSFIHDQTLFVASRKAHINQSKDGGGSFTLIYNEGDLACAYCVSALAISPDFSNDHTLLMSTVNGIHMSNDSGHAWFLKGTKTTFGNKSKLAFSPNYAKDKTIFIGGIKGLFRSVDGFKTWVKISDDTRGVDGYIEELAISPNFVNDKTILITVRGKGLFKSQDSGWTFQPIGVSLIKNNHIFALWSGFPAASSSSIRFSPNYAIDKTIFGTSSDRLFRSRDSGKTWEVVVIHSQLDSRILQPRK